MLGIYKIGKLQLLALFQLREDLIFLFLLIRLDIDRHEAVKFQSGRCHRKFISARHDLNRGRLIDSCRHPARGKPLPDQLVKTELISRKRFLHLDRCQRKIRRTDRLVRILNLSVILL